MPKESGALIFNRPRGIPDRSLVLPDLASAHEQGLKNFEVDNWHAFFLPKGTPAAIIRKLNEAIVAATRAKVARISPGFRRARDQEVGRDHQGEWRGAELRPQRRVKGAAAPSNRKFLHPR
jgi:hypothetical protein